MFKVPALQAKELVRHRVCARCHGELAIYPDPEDRNTSQIKCSTPDCACDESVSRRGVEEREAEQRSAKITAIAATRATVPWVNEMFPAKSEAEIIKQLGY